ncbi:MAG: ArsR/SmtB family transcription factor [Acidimicrobiales bacterium]
MVKGGGLDGTFGALADPTRRAIVERLMAGEHTVGELAVPFAMSLPAVSKHLTVLERAGLIVRERHGRHHRCRLRAQPLQRASAWLDRYEAFWADRFDSLANYLEEES